MPLQTLPLVAWGSPSPLQTTPWSTILGTITVTAGQADPFGGTGAVKLDDTDAGNFSYRQATIGALAAGLGCVPFCVKQDTAVETTFILFDITAGVLRGQVKLNWSGGVPTVTQWTGFSFAVPLGNGWYLVLCWNTTIVAGNTHVLRFLPAGQTLASATGAAIFYLQNMVLLDYLIDAMPTDEDRDGSDYDQSPSALEDAWSVGTDQLLSASMPYIPASPRTSPTAVSGWHGLNEFAGVNCGIAAMLRAGRNKNVLRFVYDRSVCTTYNDCYLKDPLKPVPTPEGNNSDRRVLITLRSTTPFVGI